MNSNQSSSTGSRFEDALLYAIRLHAGDVRKGSSIPYIAHLLSVCALVLEDGGEEEEAVAALLHDSLEDHPDTVSREEIEKRFGPRVLSLVEGSTDTPPEYKGGKKPPWKDRKQAYIEHVRAAGPDALRLPLADKLHNARAILADFRRIGDALWSRFNVGKSETAEIRSQILWYYRSLIAAFQDAGATGYLIEELERTIANLEALLQS
ncbi:MAG: HD domain-containing protein [Thermodesulfobacteriota bacterium]